MQQTSDIFTEIQAIAENFEIIFSQGDVTGIANFYTDTGMLLPPGSDFIQGKLDIETYWQEAINMGVKNIKLDIIEIEQHDDTAIEMSNYTLSSVDNQVLDQGKGIVIWKFENNTWKLHRDIWNSNMAQKV